MVQNNKEITQKLTILFKNLPVEVVNLYGSQARGQSDRLSDYDLGMLFSDRLTKDQKWDLRLELFGSIAKILGVNEDDVDLVDIEEVAILLQFNIIKGKIIYLKNPAKKVFLEMHIMARYHDERYYLDRFFKSTLDKITKGVYFDRRITYP